MQHKFSIWIKLRRVMLGHHFHLYYHPTEEPHGFVCNSLNKSEPSCQLEIVLHIIVTGPHGTLGINTRPEEPIHKYFIVQKLKPLIYMCIHSTFIPI